LSEKGKQLSRPQHKANFAASLDEPCENRRHGSGSRATTDMAKASANGEGTVKSIHSEPPGYGRWHAEKDRQSKLGKFLTSAQTRQSGKVCLTKKISRQKRQEPRMRP